MHRCMYCMNELNENENTCPHCGKENNGMPVNSKHIKPGTILYEKYMAGCAVDSNSIFVTYAGFDIKTGAKVLIDEYLPANLAYREKGRAQVHTKSGEYENKYYAGKDAFSDEAAELVNYDSTDIIDSFNENNTSYAVREIIRDGNTLADLIDSDSEFAKDYRKNIIVNLMRAIEPIHEAGIIHGNICPDTVIVKKDSTVKLTDFSYCGFMSRIIPIYTNEGYSPIEQYSVGSKLTVAVDVYSIAAIYYEMLTGETPLSAPERQKQDTLMPPSKMGIKVRTSMENAIMNALNIKPENRTPSVEDFYNELKSKNTVRHWERVKKAEKPPVDFYTKKSFWVKLLIWGIVFVMAVSVVVIAAEVSAIKKRAQDEENTEISTEKVPEEGDSFWDRFRIKDDTEKDDIEEDEADADDKNKDREEEKEPTTEKVQDRPELPDDKVESRGALDMPN